MSGFRGFGEIVPFHSFGRRLLEGVPPEGSTVTPWLSAVGDVSGNYKTLNERLDVNANIHTFLLGMRFTGRFADGRVNPFGQFLAGVAQSHFGFRDASESETDFAIPGVVLTSDCPSQSLYGCRWTSEPSLLETAPSASSGLHPASSYGLAERNSNIDALIRKGFAFAVTVRAIASGSVRGRQRPYCFGGVRHRNDRHAGQIERLTLRRVEIRIWGCQRGTRPGCQAFQHLGAYCRTRGYHDGATAGAPH